MDNPQLSDTQGNVRNGSEDVRNEAEIVRNGSEETNISFGTVRNEMDIRSERFGTSSEGKKNSEVFIGADVRNGSEDVRNEAEIVRNGSEELRNGSERVPNERELNPVPVPNEEEQAHPIPSEQFRTAPSCSIPHDEFSITVREAARIFEEAGVPRTERAITNWCNRNARGITRLDACYNDEERKYYIAPGSIERVIKEERKKFAYTEYKGGVLGTEAEDLSEQLRNKHAESTEAGPDDRPPAEEVVRDEPHHASPRDGGSAQQARNTEHDPQPEHRTDRSEGAGLTEDERAQLKELKMQNYELRVQLEGQKYLVRQFDTLVAGERERHEREKLALVDRLTDARYQIGSLEQKLLQIEAPRGQVRDAETSSRSEHPPVRTVERENVRYQ
jgi:hypothetical protein